MTLASDTLLSVDGLKVYFYDRSRARFSRIIEDATFRVKAGEITGLVGESGSGKTRLAFSMLGNIPHSPGIIAGKIHFRAAEGMIDLLEGIEDPEVCRREHENGTINIFKDAAVWNAKYNYEKRMRSVRGRQISIVMQSSRSSLNPYMTVDKQLLEAAKLGTGPVDEEHIGDIYRRLGLDPFRRRYPHELSGGTCFRVSIALAMAGKPRLLIADEPTTGMDSPLQVRVIDLFERYRERQASAGQIAPATLVISHNIRLITRLSEWLAVMYCGYIVERARKYHILNEPIHPYSAMLLRIARVRRPGHQQRVYGVPGPQQDPALLRTGCVYQHNCPLANATCKNEIPQWAKISDDHFVRCHHVDKL